MLETDYDMYHMGISGGKDSTAAFLWLIHESGLDPKKFLVTFCDTGNEDPLTYAYVEMMSSIHQIHVLKPGRDFWELAEWKRRFPSAKARFCTSFLKIIPSRNYIFGLLQSGLSVLLMDGIRSDEAHGSNDRGSIPKIGWDEGFACDIYHPILDWSIEDVWETHKKYVPLDDVLSMVQKDHLLTLEHKEEVTERMKGHRIPRNPVYDMGAVRVGCFPCINSRKKEIRAMAKYRPERIDFIREKEEGMANRNMYSSMFARNTVPEAHRTREIITKDGEKMMIATIDDVVLWSQTSRGGKQFEMDLDVGGGPVCELGGMCE